jgi:hypothetical protein
VELSFAWGCTYTNLHRPELRDPFSVADGQDGPGLVDEPSPSLAAEGDDLIIGLEDQFESHVSRMNCQMVSTGSSSGDLGGRCSGVMFSGTASFLVMCHPAL